MGAPSGSRESAQARCGADEHFRALDRELDHASLFRYAGVPGIERACLRRRGAMSASAIGVYFNGEMRRVHETRSSDFSRDAGRVMPISTAGFVP
jgi:hypothetical protein